MKIFTLRAHANLGLGMVFGLLGRAGFLEVALAFFWGEGARDSMRGEVEEFVDIERVDFDDAIVTRGREAATIWGKGETTDFVIQF